LIEVAHPFTGFSQWVPLDIDAFVSKLGATTASSTARAPVSDGGTDGIFLTGLGYPAFEIFVREGHAILVAVGIVFAIFGRLNDRAFSIQTLLSGPAIRIAFTRGANGWALLFQQRLNGEKQGHPKQAKAYEGQ
tara:strand:- start:3252 stop:3653 length:402 start_codon:yes stop_codon:yes gene_type:complete